MGPVDLECIVHVLFWAGVLDETGIVFSGKACPQLAEEACLAGVLQRAFGIAASQKKGIDLHCNIFFRAPLMPFAIAGSLLIKSRHSTSSGVGVSSHCATDC